MRWIALVVALVSSGCGVWNYGLLDMNGLYLCYTQPRQYIDPATKRVTWEVDWYEQSELCPETPVR